MATLGSKTWDWGLVLTGLPLCVATRAANIFPLSRLANLRRKLPLPHNLQVGRMRQTRNQTRDMQQVMRRSSAVGAALYCIR